MVITPVKLWCFFTLASASITLARNWVFFAEWGNAATNTRLSYQRCASSKQSLQPPPPPPRPSFFPSQTTLGLSIFYLAPLHLWASSQARFLRTDTRELKQKRRRRLRKRLFKSKVALLQKRYRAYSISFNSSNVGNFCLDLNSKNLYQSSGKENESRCRVFTSSTKREIWHFYVVVMQWRQRNVQNSVMHVQSCCFAKLNL